MSPSEDPSFSFFMRKTTSFLIASLLLLSGCGDAPKPLSALEAQKVFNRTFVAAQKDENPESKKGTFAMIGELSVKNTASETFPKELHSLKIGINGQYDLTTEENATGQLTVEATLNGAAEPDASFSLALKGKNLKYNLHRLTPESAKFLGLDRALGGEQGISALREKLEGKWQDYPLTDEQFKEISSSLNHVDEEKKVQNVTTAQDQAILEAFGKHEVFTASGGVHQSDGSYQIETALSPEHMIAFLNEVATIIGQQKDFSSLLPLFQKTSVTLAGTINAEQTKFLGIDGLAIIAPEIIGKSAQSPLHVLVDGKPLPNGFSWNLSLLSEEGEVNETIALSYERTKE